VAWPPATSGRSGTARRRRPEGGSSWPPQAKRSGTHWRRHHGAQERQRGLKGSRDAAAASSASRPWRPRSGTRGGSERRQAGGEWRAASEQRRLGHPHLGCRGQTARGDGEGAWRPCKKATRHIVEHVVRVEVSRAGVSSGWLQAELVTGPKTKFEARELLFIFHLETKVIRALQQRVIRPQTISVSALITVTEIHFRRSKLGQTQCNFLHALLHSITFNFYFWTNSSCLTNFGERGMPTSLLSETDLE